MRRVVLLWSVAVLSCSGLWLGTGLAQGEDSDATAAANFPLVTRAAIPPRPNLLLTLDDLQHMYGLHPPDQVPLTVGAYTNVSIWGSYTTRYSAENELVPVSGQRLRVVAGLPGSASLLQRKLRSPDVNPQYYNPDVRYLPWLKPDGSRMPPADAALAPLFPELVPSGKATINLRDPSTPDVAVWCGLPGPHTYGCQVVRYSSANAQWEVCQQALGGNEDDRLVDYSETSWNEVLDCVGSTWVSWSSFVRSAGSPGGADVTPVAASPYFLSEAEAAPRHHPALLYRLQRDGNGAYLNPEVASNYVEYNVGAASFSPSWERSEQRTDCTASQCSRAEELQNFANWFVYHRSRELSLKGAVLESTGALDNVVRLGFGRILGNTRSVDGVMTRSVAAGVRDLHLAQRQALFDWLLSWRPSTVSSGNLYASTGQDLGAAMRGVLNYFKRTDKRGPWSAEPASASSASPNICRRNYHMLVSGDAWTGILESPDWSDLAGLPHSAPADPGSNRPARSYQYQPAAPFRDGLPAQLSDLTLRAWDEDLRPDLPDLLAPTTANPAFWQHLVHFTFGMGFKGTLDPDQDLAALSNGSKTWRGNTYDDYWHAALNGRGHYASTRDGAELGAKLASAVHAALGEQVQGSASSSASVEETDLNRRYVAQYTPGIWSGNLQAQTLSVDGRAGAAVWSAESRLPVHTVRNIATWDGTSGMALDWARLSAATPAARALRLRMGSRLSEHGQALLDYLRGDRSQEGWSKPFRWRGVRSDGNGTLPRLGDVVNAVPLYVGPGQDQGYAGLPGVGVSYGSFVNRAVSGLVLLGANDGMLHAFTETLGQLPDQDGVERYAYMPRGVLDRVGRLADKDYGDSMGQHRLFVDGPLTQAHAFLGGESGAGSWRSLVIGTLGAGGRAVYALDVTDPQALSASSVRWEIEDDDLGHVTAAVEHGRLPDGRWVAVFGNGGFSPNGRSVLFVVELGSGATHKLVLPSGAALGGVRAVRDASGTLQQLYAGDNLGQLWRFNPSGLSTGSGWVVAGGQPLFRATDALGQAQPISVAPLVFDRTQGGFMVMLATGRLLSAADARDGQTQSIYAVWDQTTATSPATTVLRGDLAVRRLVQVNDGAIANARYFRVEGGAVEWGSQRGWRLDLQSAAGERAVFALQALGSRVASVSSLIPLAADPDCGVASGQGLVYLLPAETGLSPAAPMLDTDASGAVTSDDALASVYVSSQPGGTVWLQAPSGSSAPSAPSQCGASQLRWIDVQDGTPRVVCVDQNTSGSVVQRRTWRRILRP